MFEFDESMYLSYSQYLGLYNFYNSTNGDYWTWLSPYNQTNGYPWDFTNSSSLYSDPCSVEYPWQGVICSSVCSAEICNVLSLSLSNYNLTGNHFFGSLHYFPFSLFVS